MISDIFFKEGQLIVNGMIMATIKTARVSEKEMKCHAFGDDITNTIKGLFGKEIDPIIIVDDATQNTYIFSGGKISDGGKDQILIQGTRLTKKP